MLIDTHCHLNDSKAFPNPDEEVKIARELGVEKMIVVGVQPSEWESTVELCERHEELFCILGWHPNYTANYDPAQLQNLEKLLQNPKALAIGEIGLDYYWDYSPKETQTRALQDQLALAAKLKLPAVFHARDAYSDLLTELENTHGHGWLLHCFLGSQDDANRAVKLGCYFGVDGPVSYKKSDDLRAVLTSIPKDRLVVETDAPYMTPTPYRGKPNRPAYVKHVAEALAVALQISPDECANLTTQNAIRFFGPRLA
jgi:TatD DNase family protein